MTKPGVPHAVRNLPLGAKVVLALTSMLLPLGLFAAWVALADFRREQQLGVPLSAAQLGAMLLPLVMWLAALVTGWLIANQLLVRPLVMLRRGVERYAAGDRSVRLSGRDFFSQEVAMLAQAFDRLADESAVHRETLETSLAAQKRLTREVHHRVKNNLQIVSSLLSLQARDATSTDVAQAYAAIQARVGALALVHRWMYDEDSAHGVDLRALATDLCAALEQGIGAAMRSPVSLHCDVGQIVVGQDTAVPVAFLITELVSAAARRAAPHALAGAIRATVSGTTTTLSVTAPPFCGEGLGAHDQSRRILDGLARQLRAPLVHDGGAGSYSISFAIPATARKTA